MSDRLRILFIVHNQTRKGGAYYRGLNLGAPLARRGHAVAMMAIHPAERVRVVERDLDGVNLVETPDLLWGVGRTGWDPWNTLRRTLLDTQPQVRRHPHRRHATGRLVAGTLGPQEERRSLGCRLDRLVGSGWSDNRAGRVAGPEPYRAIGAMVRGEDHVRGRTVLSSFPMHWASVRKNWESTARASSTCRREPIRQPFATLRCPLPARNAVSMRTAR